MPTKSNTSEEGGVILINYLELIFLGQIEQMGGTYFQKRELATFSEEGRVLSVEEMDCLVRKILSCVAKAPEKHQRLCVVQIVENHQRVPEQRCSSRASAGFWGGGGWGGVEDAS